MKTINCSPQKGKAERSIHRVVGDCLEDIGIIIPYGGYIITDRGITPYADKSKDYTFEAEEIYGVVTEVFGVSRQVYCRGSI